jgi:homoserine dehydrogenase
MERVRVGLVGLGTVGASLYELVTRNAGALERGAGARVEIPYVGVRNPAKPRDVLPGTRVVQGWREILDDPDVPIVVELMGGVEEARQLALEAIGRRRHLITANKALLAAHGEELFELAGRQGVELAFEASVCGGIPIVKVLRESLMGNRINRILGIVNGTTNYILTRMTEEGVPYEEALADAQRRGFAEKDPSLDVDGGDAAQKISLLAGIAFGTWVDWRQVLREGITRVSPGDIAFARSAGFLIKPVAQARMVEGSPSVTVYPALVPDGHPLAAVRGEFNAVMVDADFLGPSVYVGRGAGGGPTASALASDLGDLVRVVAGGGRAGFRSHRAGGAAPAQAPVPAGAGSFDHRPLYPVEKLCSRYCFHFVTANRPGIWALVTGTCADNGINIESVHQKWEDRSRPSDLFMLVDEAEEAQVRTAFGRLVSSPGISPESRYFRILEEEGGTR